MYRSEGLMIVGGVQDPDKQNNMQILLYKTENHLINGIGPNSSYEIKVDYKPHIANEKDFEICIN